MGGQGQVGRGLRLSWRCGNHVQSSRDGHGESSTGPIRMQKKEPGDWLGDCDSSRSSHGLEYSLG